MTDKFDRWEATGSDAFPPSGSTITPPTAERLSPYLRAELARIHREVEAARDALKRLLEQA